MKLIDHIKGSWIYSQFLETTFAKNFYIKRGVLLDADAIDARLELAPPVLLDVALNQNLKVGIVKDGRIKIEGYAHRNSSWIFYERFLKNNNISYVFYDIYSSDWIEKASSLDIIFWHTFSSPIEMYIAESKIYTLDKIMQKECFPNFHEVWQYEDKVRASFLYEVLDLPGIKTFISNSKNESYNFLKHTKFPKIFKTLIGAGSRGVRKIDSPNQASKLVERIFSNRGLKTSYPYFRQKDLVFLQEFVDDAKFDLRIMIIGEKAFGYYRYPKKDDFKASGSGIYEKKKIPLVALKLALKIKQKLNSRLIGVDLLFSEATGEYRIIETSLFNQIDTPEQLVINGVAGYYDLSSDEFPFREGKFWIHELVAELVVKEFLKTNK